MQKTIAIIKGDGIGPEIINESIKVLKQIERKYSHKFEYKHALLGGEAIDKTGVPLPDETLKICNESDGILLGAVGGPKWDNIKKEIRPEVGLLQLRKSLNLFANLRPIKLNKYLVEKSPLKNEIIEEGVDFIVVRELTGGIYFGEKGEKIVNNIKYAYDIEIYNEEEIKKIGNIAFEIANDRDKKVLSVDKANVLESSRLWRKTIEDISSNYNDINLSNMYVDNASMQIIKNPSQFDVIVTNNIFGDIISDEASIITGSIGMAPSASIRFDKFGMYEPIHGSAPEIAGENIANPIGSILSVAMMLRYSFNLKEEADDIENAVGEVLKEGYNTQDILTKKGTLVSTEKMGDLIVSKIKSK